MVSVEVQLLNIYIQFSKHDKIPVKNNAPVKKKAVPSIEVVDVIEEIGKSSINTINTFCINFTDDYKFQEKVLIQICLITAIYILTVPM